MISEVSHCLSSSQLAHVHVQQVVPDNSYIQNTKGLVDSGNVNPI